MNRSGRKLRMARAEYDTESKRNGYKHFGTPN